MGQSIDYHAEVVAKGLRAANIEHGAPEMPSSRPSQVSSRPGRGSGGPVQGSSEMALQSQTVRYGKVTSA